MSRPKKKSKSELLTDAELEMMGILWHLQQGTVADVLAELPGDRQLAYTTASTILRILEQKGFVEATKAGRGHSYAPLISRADYGERSVSHLVTRVFDGEPTALVKCLAQRVDLNDADQKIIADLLARMEKA